MKKVLDLIKKWMNLDHHRPWEKEPPEWEDTAPSEYEPHD
jgi:hypothetical protein